MGQHRFTSGVTRLFRKVTTSVVLYPSFSNPGKTEDSLAIARDADEMVFFTPS